MNNIKKENLNIYEQDTIYQDLLAKKEDDLIRLEIVKDFEKMLIDEFVNSASIQDYILIKKTLRDICPVKVKKITKKILKKYKIKEN